MGKARKTRQFAAMKRTLSTRDPRLQENKEKEEQKQKDEEKERVRNVPKYPTNLFFTHNTSLGPPYFVILDTNFINFSIKNKLDIMRSLMDCLLAKCVPCVPEAVIAELEKLGPKYRIALRLAKDPRFLRLPTAGTYADDAIVNLVMEHRCFIVATCDKDLKRRIRKIPGVPIMYIQGRKYTIERMAEAYGAPK